MRLFSAIHREMLELVAKYLQLADPEMPIVPSDSIPNFTTTYNFIR
jgi:hypothetical protein